MADLLGGRTRRAHRPRGAAASATTSPPRRRRRRSPPVSLAETRAPGARPAARQGRRDRPQLPRARRRGGRRPAAGAARLRQVAERGRRAWRRHPLGSGADGAGRLRGGARGRHRPDGPPGVARPTRSTTSSATPASTTSRRATSSSATASGSAASRSTRSARWARALVTADEIPDPQALAIECRVERRGPPGRRTPREMYFGVAEIISYCSRSFTLEPGDVIATGTPGGVGVFRDPPRFLGDGDVVTVEIERIGRLENTCRFEVGAGYDGRAAPTAASRERDGERFLVTGALGCIGAWTVRELVREGAPVVAFDLGTEHAPARPDHDARRARGASPSSPATSPTSPALERVARRARHHERHPPRRAAGAVLPRRPAARRRGQRRRHGQRLRGRPAPRRCAMAPVVYTSSIGMYSPTDVDPVTGRLEEDAVAHPATTTASTSWRTRATPGSTGSTPACRASGCGR